MLFTIGLFLLRMPLWWKHSNYTRHLGAKPYSRKIRMRSFGRCIGQLFLRFWWPCANRRKLGNKKWSLWQDNGPHQSFIFSQGMFYKKIDFWFGNSDDHRVANVGFHMWTVGLKPCYPAGLVTACLQKLLWMDHWWLVMLMIMLLTVKLITNVGWLLVHWWLTSSYWWLMVAIVVWITGLAMFGGKYPSSWLLMITV